jgi:hypothetical protein
LLARVVAELASQSSGTDVSEQLFSMSCFKDFVWVALG